MTLRIADCGLRIDDPNPQSAIHATSPFPQSAASNNLTPVSQFKWPIKNTMRKILICFMVKNYICLACNVKQVSNLSTIFKLHIPDLIMNLPILLFKNNLI